LSSGDLRARSITFEREKSRGATGKKKTSRLLLINKEFIPCYKRKFIALLSVRYLIACPFYLSNLILKIPSPGKRQLAVSEAIYLI
jgi:hypothetical protein